MDFGSATAVTLGLPIFLLLPGYITVTAYRALCVKTFDCTPAEIMFVSVAASVFFASWLGLVLAEAGVFSIVLLVGVLLAYSLAIFVFVRARVRALLVPRFSRDLETVSLSAVLALAAALYIQPFDYIIGGLDSGVYVNTGVNLARTGSLLIYDRGITDLSDSEAALFFRLGAKPKPFEIPNAVLPGFYVADRSAGIVQPHGFHVFPTWIAILYSLGGVKAGLLATPIFGVLGVASLYFAAKRMFGFRVAILASFLLTVSVSQIWFSRFPVSEVLVQFFLFSGIYLFALATDHESGFLSMLSGLSFGMVHLTKIELLLLPFSVLCFLFIVWGARRFRRRYQYFLIGYIAVGAYALLHAVTFASSYTLAHINSVVLPLIRSLLSLENPARTLLEIARFPGTSSMILSIGTLAAMMLLCWIGIRYKEARYSRSPFVLKGWAGVMLFGVVTLLAAYAWFVRPYYPTADQSLPTMEAAALANSRSSLVRLGWYISPLGVLLGLAGFVKAVVDRQDIKLAFFLSIVVPTSLLFLYDSLITPHHFWAGRRFVYVLAPTFLVFTAYALNAVMSKKLSFKENIVAGSIFVALVLTMLRPIAPFLLHIDYKGASNQLAELASMLPVDGISLFKYSLESHMFATPLRFIYTRDVWMLAEDAEYNEQLHRLVQRWLDEGTRVYWITVGDEKGALDQWFDLLYVGREQVSLPEAPNARDSLPGKPHQFEAELQVYEVTGNAE